jgi:carbonic anhydrase
LKVITKEIQSAMTPKEALLLLKEGNKRFVNNERMDRDLLQQANETVTGQHPFAVTLSCIDSRTSIEHIFDQGIGHLFSARVAGNIVNEDILGSMEFSCKVAGSKIIAVLGHTSCGAVKGACDHVEMGNLTALLSKIQPAVAEEKSVENDRTSSNADFVEKVTIINVRKAVATIMDQSPILKEMIDAGEIGIVGGLHDIATGEVHFYDDCTFIN